jgi:hypothetical protein
MEVNYNQRLKDLKKINRKMKEVAKIDTTPANTYDPMIAASPYVSNKRAGEILDFTKSQIKKGIKAIPEGFKARANVRKNIKSMANSAAQAELNRTKILEPSQRGTNQAFNRANAAYKETKKNLKKQVPRKYRSIFGI